MQQFYIDSNNQVQTPRSKHEFSLDDPNCEIPEGCPTLMSMTPEQRPHFHRMVEKALYGEVYGCFDNGLIEVNERKLHDPVYLENYAALLVSAYGDAAFDDDDDEWIVLICLMMNDNKFYKKNNNKK